MQNENDKKLHFRASLTYFVGFLVLLAIILFALSFFSDQRKRSVYENYATETEDYINRNRGGLTKLFNDVFVPCAGNDYLCTSNQAITIPHLVSSDLRDWSSTMFIKMFGEDVYYMRLSGDISKLPIYSDDRRVSTINLLRGDVLKIPWDDYTYEFAYKEVVIPVRDESGKILGAMVRGVIEPKSF